MTIKPITAARNTLCFSVKRNNFASSDAGMPVAAAATGMAASDEAKLFRFTLKHSVLLAVVIGLIVSAYAYL